jgi:anti-sigma regulatory factor (Ser/Thr protein kinase)
MCETIMDPSPTPHLPSAVAAEHVHLQIPSKPEWIAPTVDYLKQKAVLCGACQESRVRKLTVALHEALTNAVVHGNLELSSDLKEHADVSFAEAMAARAADPRYGERLVDVEMDYDGERCRWAVTDQGRGFDVEQVLRQGEADPEALLRPSGRGILMMRAFLDEVAFESGGRRVLLTLYRASGEEKRRHPRLALQRQVRVTPICPDGSVDWDAAYGAVAQNLSQDGMAILQARLATTGRVLIGLDWEGQLLQVPAEVRHCRAMEGDVVEIGCRFQTAVPAAAPAAEVDEVQQAVDTLLARLEGQHVPSVERRAHPRAVYTGRLGIAGGPPSEPAFGFARNLSRGGIAFLATAPLALGPRVLSLSQAGGAPLRVLAEILRCVPIMSGVFDVGARFLALERG